MLFEDDYTARRASPVKPNSESVLNLLPKEAPPVKQTERYYSIHSPKVETKTRAMATMGLLTNFLYSSFLFLSVFIGILLL